ncbi:hypothetical protein I307_03963 [Cryptococcus deuterogattii 99/473]|uniref:Unplaced genomic scaffold supercont1.5, whole genome shotgun sequence n=1 Tax=Cryptococcus deuterogattii Ram5 TaxID=1296110 RepID=A0A0D0V1W4_9TREE|nr:hypothetical protein I309_01707 [Cryptococcus deuterogattii LA55]KIR34198.1 hypothetical protein I352_03435 [Cryptococcus deuterogattii MMRL2647]KIR41416.1 hypothetical protein I313_02543 [Cryptococcus deuterogattii Ram5]KIR71658.1 hypothetical protein I310_04334 [Cryptococcus deuterogattii CA1014]KIR91241.1 hypothetical protein I304_04708 [Cryptococcus deuterogattii CBS 10090]KIR98570.1 hypothetical protein L804_04146 [Cryptococcus deuterogattii 2001/935-1]KIY56502.1 hypothetical protein 
MQLGRYSVSTLVPPPIHSITFSPDGRFFAVAAEKGYEIWKTWPLGLVRRRVLPGSLALAVILPHAPLLVLQAGGTAPLYAPNKVVIYNDKLGEAVAEIEFGERIRGVVARRGMICVSLLRKVVAFEYRLSADDVGKGKSKMTDRESDGFWIKKFGEWETAKNEQGLMAIATAPGSTLLTLPGRQPGHVQLVPLPPCPSPSSPGSPTRTSVTSQTTFRSPIILAHTHPLSTLGISPSGSHIITTSERGTLLRIWDTSRGRLERELRRGVDPAEMWGATFERDGKGARVAGWSDKGTIHVWGGEGSKAGQNGSRPQVTMYQILDSRADRSFRSTPPSPSLTNILSRNLPLPKYFSSITSTAQYRLPRKNPHAFSAALGAAGVPSMAMKEAVEGDGERGERFIVEWIEVDVAVEDHKLDDRDRTKEDFKTQYRSSSNMSTMGGLPMGTREERMSFGSEGTSRTATPSQRVETPTPGGMMFGRGRGRDWYRLKIPEGAGRGESSSGGEDGKTNAKCELVEYRRLAVGGGGW